MGGGGWNNPVYSNCTHKFGIKIYNNAVFPQDLVPMDTQTQLGNSKEHVRIVYNSVCKLKDIAERMVTRATNYACDMLQFGQELR